MRRAGIVSLVLVSVLGMVMGMLRGPLAVTEDVLWPLSWVAWPLVGGVILIRRPANRIGIACMLIGVVWGLAFIMGRERAIDRVRSGGRCDVVCVQGWNFQCGQHAS